MSELRRGNPRLLVSERADQAHIGNVIGIDTRGRAKPGAEMLQGEASPQGGFAKLTPRSSTSPAESRPNDTDTGQFAA